MGQFTAILAGTAEGKTLYAIRKLAEHVVRCDCTVIFFSDENNIMQRCRSYEGVQSYHHATVVSVHPVVDCIETMKTALSDRDYDCIIVDVARFDDEFINYVHGLSKDHSVFVTIQSHRASIESDILTDVLPPEVIIPLASRIVFLLRDDVGIIAEYNFDKDSRSFSLCRYYFIETGVNKYPRLDLFGELYDPTEHPWQIADKIDNHVQSRSPIL